VYLPEELLVGDEVRLKNMVVANDLHVKSLATGRRVVTAVYCPQWVGPGDGGMGMAIDELFAGSVAAVFPSNYEPFLLTGLEAGQEGTPLVISRASGFSDAVREYDQKMGAVHGAILVDNVKLPQRELVVDYAMALDSILYAYLRDRRTYRMMSSEVFRLAKDMSWEEPVRRYHDILRSAHGEAGAHPA
jgi:glycogen synthase